MSLTVGTRLGPYEVVARLGEGGMGEVYRARDSRLNRDVALKILPEAFANDPDRLARFRREAQVLASLSHPNIGHIYGLEEAGTTQALVLELIEGPTLAEVISRHGHSAPAHFDELSAPRAGRGAAAAPSESAPAAGAGPRANEKTSRGAAAHGGGAPRALSIDDALAIARQIAEALEAAHEHGIVHRDLKPANVKVRDDGVVKVLDFGLAKAVQGDGSGLQDPSPAVANSPTLTARATELGMILGTAAYMAPEQARGRPVDKRADIWAFGVVLY